MNIVDLARHYIEPEAKRLISSGEVDRNFKIRQALVLLPRGQSPIIEFNENIGWEMKMDTSAFTPGQAVYLHDIRKILGVAFPKVAGEKVAFIFMYYTGAGEKYSLIFDFSPNNQSPENIPDYGYAGDVVLTNYYNLLFSELALRSLPNKKREALSTSGYFIAPSIMPYPFTVLCDPKNELEDFITALRNYYSNDRLRSMVKTWADSPGWKDRINLFLEAIDNIEDSRYLSAIKVLVPELEGTLRDTIQLLYSDDSKMNPQGALAFLQKKMEQKDLPAMTRAYLSSFSEYFNDTSGLFVSFRKWSDNISDAIISRHAISHGKNVKEMYTRDNCVRLLLIISTIHDIYLALSDRENSILPM